MPAGDCLPREIQTALRTDTAIRVDHNAFAMFFKEHSKRVNEQAMRLTGSETDAKDLVQEVFLKCWLKRKDLESVRDIPGYIFILTRNFYISHWRKQRSEQISLTEYCRYYRQLYPPTDDPVQEKEYQRLLEGAIQDLPLRQQQVFIMGKELSMRRKEVALKLKMSELTVKNHMARAVKKIKDTIEDKLAMQINAGQRIGN